MLSKVGIVGLRVLMSDDDPDDHEMVQTCLMQAMPNATLDWVMSGDQLMSYLYRNDPYANARRPDLIFMDIEMPGKRGTEVLIELKRNPFFRRIPVIMFSTSQTDIAVTEAYHNGASSYVVKASDYTQFQRSIASIVSYWSSIVLLPAG